MWKTRFEVSTHNGNNLTRHRTLSSSSKIINHHYSSRSLPKVPRVREDSPSAIVRPSSSSSIPNLDIVTEEDEDIPYSNTIDNEQPNLIRKQFSYQNLNKRQIVLPTIIESNDYDINNESIDDRHNKYVIKTQDSFVGTNTNYNQVRNIDIERKERILNTNKNNDTIGFTLDKRINELIQQKRQRQNKSLSLATEINNNEFLIPTTFKDITAFFQNKAFTEQKKIIRAKRSLSLNRHRPINNNEVPKSEIIEDKSNIFHHQIKRIKRTHVSDSIDKPELKIEDKDRPKISRKNILLKRWFILLLILTMFIYFYISNIDKNPFSSFYFRPQQSKASISLINNNKLISQYGQFVRNYFFSSLDLFITFIGQIFFRIDKYEYQNNIVYVASSTYEHIYEYFFK